METAGSYTVNKSYIISIIALIFVLPLLSLFAEWLLRTNVINVASSAGKWFIFYAGGLRLFIAGIRQITNPSFTAKKIFHFKTDESFFVIKELGFANVCLGLTGVISICLMQWRVVSAFSCGLYYGLAGLGHFARKTAAGNEKFAMITDIIAFIILMVYVFAILITA